MTAVSAPSGAKTVNSQQPYMSSAVPTQSADSNFFAYFLTAVVLCIVLYLAFHNKQKVRAGRVAYSFAYAYAYNYVYYI